MKITSPGSSAWRAASSRAAPASMATCRSCPQACITPSNRELYGSPVASVTGSASMSPRSSTTGRAWPGSLAGAASPLSTAVTELSLSPVLTSSGSPSSAASTRAWVSGRSRPISGSRWMACRSSASSPAIAAASSRSPIAAPPLGLFGIRHLVVDHVRVALQQVPLVLGVVDRAVDVLARERLDGLDRVPEAQRDDLFPVPVGPAQQPGPEVAGGLLVALDSGVLDVGRVLVRVRGLHHAPPQSRDHPQIIRWAASEGKAL